MQGEKVGMSRETSMGEKDLYVILYTIKNLKKKKRKRKIHGIQLSRLYVTSAIK